MKKIILISMMLLFGVQMFAQTPFLYQAVVRDRDGALLSEHAIRLDYEIAHLGGVERGSQTVTTNKQGLISTNFIVPSGISWRGATLKVDVTYDGTTIFGVPLPINPLPYALHAEMVNFANLPIVTTISNEDDNTLATEGAVKRYVDPLILWQQSFTTLPAQVVNIQQVMSELPTNYRAEIHDTADVVRAEFATSSLANLQALSDSARDLRGAISTSEQDLRAELQDSASALRGDLSALSTQVITIQQVMSELPTNCRAEIHDTADVVRAEFATADLANLQALTDSVRDLRGAILTSEQELRAELQDSASALRADLSGLPSQVVNIQQVMNELPTNYRAEIHDTADVVRAEFATSTLANLQALTDSARDLRGAILTSEQDLRAELQDSASALRVDLSGFSTQVINIQQVMNELPTNYRAEIHDTADVVRAEFATSSLANLQALSDSARDLRGAISTSEQDLRAELQDSASALRADLSGLPSQVVHIQQVMSELPTNYRAEIHDTADVVRAEFATSSLANLQALSDSARDLRGAISTSEQELRAELQDSASALRGDLSGLPTQVINIQQVMSELPTNYRAEIHDTADVVRAEFATADLANLQALSDSARDLRGAISTSEQDLRAELQDSASALRADLSGLPSQVVHIQQVMSELPTNYRAEIHDTADVVRAEFAMSSLANLQALSDSARDLRGAISTSEQDLRAELQDSASALRGDLDGKVDKEAEKGLSSNDFTTLEKLKLSTVEAGAQVNVKSDWLAVSGDAEILNKPLIPDLAPVLAQIDSISSQIQNQLAELRDTMSQIRDSIHQINDSIAALQDEIFALQQNIHLSITSEPANQVLPLCDGIATLTYTATELYGVTYEWTVDDEVFTTTVNTLTEIYMAAGTYTVSVSALGKSATITTTITAGGASPTMLLCDLNTSNAVELVERADIVNIEVFNSSNHSMGQISSIPSEGSELFRVGQVLSGGSSPILSGEHNVVAYSENGCSVSQTMNVRHVITEKCRGARNPNESGSHDLIDSVRDHEGNWYDVVQIDNYCWMRENLRTTSSPKNPSVSYLFSYSLGYAQPPRGYYYDGLPENGNSLGMLYTWAAALDTTFRTNAESNITLSGQRQGICPDGWHLPSNKEWGNMLNWIAYRLNYASHMTSEWLSEWYDYSNMSISAPLSGSCLWNSTPDVNSGLTFYENPERNYFGFTAVPAGKYDGQYVGKGESAYFWTSGSQSAQDATARKIQVGQPGPTIPATNKTDALSVRCIRNYR